MPAEIPSEEPTEHVAGDTLAWTKSLSDYPADDSWTLTYYLLGPKKETITASADGADHAVTVSASTTSNYAPGVYKWTSYASSGSERYKVGEGTIEILPNPATVAANVSTETRSKAKQILDALMATMADAAGRPEQSYSLQAAGRSFSFKTLADLIAAIDYWKAEVKREDSASSIGKNIFVRFNRP
jgi:hypothetical protein